VWRALARWAASAAAEVKGQEARDKGRKSASAATRVRPSTLNAQPSTKAERWRLLAVMALHECAEWSDEWIGAAFGLDRSRISQIRAQAREVLPAVLAPSPRDLQESRRDLSGAVAEVEG
jgi:hypothetical protein